MTDQINPTPEAEEAAPAAPEQEQEERPIAQPAPAPKPSVSLVDRRPGRDDFNDDDDNDDDNDDDDFDSDDDDGDDDDESSARYVSGPSDYVQRERGGRGRRIGNDVRVDDIDYKNVPLLSRFLDRRGRILSRRKTKVPAKVQRRIVTAIKRARHLALLPYTADHTRIVRRRR